MFFLKKKLINSFFYDNKKIYSMGFMNYIGRVVTLSCNSKQNGQTRVGWIEILENVGKKKRLDCDSSHGLHESRQTSKSYPLNN